MSAVVLVVLSLHLAQTDPKPSPDRIGVRVEDFTLRDYRGQQHRLSDWKDSKQIVVVFLGIDCPLSKLYGARLADLAREYAGRGVAFVGIHANQNESLTGLARFARDHHIEFPLLRDVGNILADRFGATRTPEAFLLDEGRVIRYHGRIDDQYGVGQRRQVDRQRDLAEALDELLAGKAVSRPVTAPVGCLISRMAPPGQGRVTWTRDIAPILQQHCQVCHRPGQVAPFALTTWKDAAGWSAMIREVVEQVRMPPWSASPLHGRFANDPSLSASEKQLLFDWIDADCPEGDPADLVPAPRFPEGWNIPRVDQVVSISAPFTVPAQGVLEYQFFEVDPGFKEDRWIQAAEIRPSNRAVVHHCSVFLRAPGSQELAEQGKLGSFFLTGLAPGTQPMVLSDGRAKLVPAGWRLVFVVHYIAVGSEQTDQTELALAFADPKTVRQEVATKLMVDTDLSIPAHEANHQVSQTWRINDPVLLLSFFPHMHLRGKSFRYEVVFPDGQEEVLLDVPHYDFNWQHRYVLAEPRRLPAGTLIRCVAVYDNSANNPLNPDPSATVVAGPQSWDEMFNGYFDVVLADQDLTAPVPWTHTLWSALRPVFSPGVSLLAVLFGGLFLTRRRIGALLTRAPSRSGDQVIHTGNSVRADADRGGHA